MDDPKTEFREKLQNLFAGATAALVLAGHEPDTQARHDIVGQAMAMYGKAADVIYDEAKRQGQHGGLV